MNANTKPKVRTLVDWQPGGVSVTIDIDDEGHVFLSSVRPAGVAAVKSASRYSALPPAEARLAGEGGEAAESKRQANGYLSRRLQYVEHGERAQRTGR